MKLKYTHGLIILLLLIALPIFGHLDELPLELWDESRLAESAIEMNTGGDYIVVHYANSPDMWSTKPPFMIWLQVVCIKLMGANELATRMPSALSALATCLLIYWLLGKRHKSPLLGLLSCLVLVTSAGYVKLHGIRTGDYDPILTMFLFASTVFFYLYIEDGKKKHLLLFLPASYAGALPRVSAAYFSCLRFLYMPFIKRSCLVY